MMSPRSFLYYNRQPSASTTPTSSAPSSSSLTPNSTTNSYATSLSSTFVKTATTTTTVPINTTRTAQPSALLDRKKDAQNVSVTVTPIPTTSTTTSATMAKRKDARRETTKLAPSSPPRTTTSVTTRPTTPTTPVQIPSKARSNPSHGSHRHAQRKPLRPRDVHSPDAVPPAMLALLAVTDIPRPRRTLRQRFSRDQHMTLEAVIERQQVCEKELSLTFGSKSPMDLLLSPPDDLTDDDMSISDSGLGSVLSTRTVSVESVPSLGDSFSTDTLSSVESPYGFSPRRKRSRQPRRSLEPVSSPPGQPEDHPLSRDRVNVDDLDFRVFDESQDEEDTKSEFSFSDYTFPLRPLKSAFKSNLTASLRALRSAARSISAINFSSIPPDDFLTRSILTIDPKVPYTDERRPPVLEEEPSAALRRYLNPTTNARIEPHTPTATATGTRSFTASIQMQTYKVQRSRSTPPTSIRSPSPTTSASTTQSPTLPYQPPAQSPNQTAFTYPPGGMRQREMRENSDFIRIAVMEMAMRKQGKLDDQRPGRARWALPPRKANVRAYEVGADGVPARWIPASN
ncbi:hypothetical protein CH063_06681 [Colletotrichum higginsianum]|uniref:Uncharacterized protein n=2 Tax=Colletotrichum higginsianum TaxID=80884 RepID=H1V3F3_COLHI|nr:hypothetical protein CH63R_02145 [Colletotrichum higginsianum IMI 349063]OBR13419.1 hypothetical protein CH63R_02145 [Colletotrichum higginsianum IMI 349063]TID01505.1 hypothetical protein CH35J_003650 [Colletotrichum higginsianum]CCF34755.1 hypothetical protein CH063_06681 [Colletotrichum higginsianum]